jgi:hypothetical protein
VVDSVRALTANENETTPPLAVATAPLRDGEADEKLFPVNTAFVSDDLTSKNGVPFKFDQLTLAKVALAVTTVSPLAGDPTVTVGAKRPVAFKVTRAVVNHSPVSSFPLIPPKSSMKIVTSKTEFGDVEVKADALTALRNKGATPAAFTFAASVTEEFPTPAADV